VQVHENDEFRAIRGMRNLRKTLEKLAKPGVRSVLARQLAVKRKPLNMKGLCVRCTESCTDRGVRAFWLKHDAPGRGLRRIRFQPGDAERFFPQYCVVCVAPVH